MDNQQEYEVELLREAAHLSSQHKWNNPNEQREWVIATARAMMFTFPEPVEPQPKWVEVFRAWAEGKTSHLDFRGMEIPSRLAEELT